jgi:hypothetical protein
VNRWAAAAFIAAAVGALVLSFAPLGEICSPGVLVLEPGERSAEPTCQSVSLFSKEPWVLVVASIPVLLTLIPVVIRRRSAATVSAVLLWVGCIAGLLSIGLYFVPAAILMTVAAGQDVDIAASTAATPR